MECLLSQLNVNATSTQVIMTGGTSSPPAVVGGDMVSKANRKVQLDLEDADFLKEIEEEPKERTPEKVEVDEDAENKKKRKKKIIIISSAVILFLLLLSVAYFYFFTDTITGPKKEPYIVIVKDYKDPELAPVYTEVLEPFWVQMKNEQGETFFLVCNFAMSTEDADLSIELRTNLALIRDIIYYYLRTKDYRFLTDTNNFLQIKKDLLALINDKLAVNSLKDILYENYMIR